MIFLVVFRKFLQCFQCRVVLETKDYVYIFEFKPDGTAAEALQQIEDKGYATPYQTDTRKVTAIGVSFSSETMTVEEWEEKTL